MKFLLDTHIFLWYITGNAQLPMRWREMLMNPANEVYLSVVSIWEACVKYKLGKLPLPQPPEVYLSEARQRHLVATLPLFESAVKLIGRLPEFHRDPFDRMLICQAMDLDLTFMTVDEKLFLYPVKTIPTA